MTDAPPALEIVDQLLVYDRMVENWLKTAPLSVEGRPVPVIFATPDRAFATVKELVTAGYGESRGETARNIPLPFISFNRTEMVYDPARFHGTYTVWPKVATANNGLLAYSTIFPKPFNLAYQVEVWAKNRGILNIYQLWSSGWFQSHEMMLYADFSPLWTGYGRKVIPVENMGIIDNSDIEVDESEERKLRFTQRLLVKGWLLGGLEEVKTVQTVQTDYYLTHNSPENFHTATIEEIEGDPETFVPVT